MRERKLCGITGCKSYARKYEVCQKHLTEAASKSKAEGGIFAEENKSQPQPHVSKYELAGADIGRLVSKKQEAYGDSFGKAGEVVRQLYPNGIRPDQYDSVLTVVRVIDKLFRIATAPGAFGENPWKDIGGYSLLEVVKGENESIPASSHAVRRVPVDSGRDVINSINELWKKTHKPVRSYAGGAVEDGWDG